MRLEQVEKAAPPRDRKAVVADAISGTAERKGMTVGEFLATREGEKIYAGYRAL